MKCPKCGNEDPKKFRYLERILCWRQVEDFLVHPVVTDAKHKDVLVINGLYKTGEGYDEGDEAEIECHNYEPEFCGYTFPIPCNTELYFR